MAATPVPPDNSLPIEVGYKYAIKPGALAGCWLEVIGIYRGYVYTRGIENCTADWIVPIWKFDDLVGEYISGVLFLSTENGIFVLATEDGFELVMG